jgi:perosamine synthetase
LDLKIHRFCDKITEGTSMKINQFEPFIGQDEYEAIKACFDDNWITEGVRAKEFNQKLCDLIGVKYGVFAPNGTLAIYLALRSLNIGPGDEVIVPDFTFLASASAVEMVGATPVFCDINKNDLQIDVSDCTRLLTKKTKAIMPVHIYGLSANMDEVMSFAKKHNLLVIEDAAQALGIKWNGKGCGSFGDVATFSFFADKTITTGEGGFVCTNNKETYENLLYLRNQGRIDRGSFIHPKMGYNFRMTDIQAAIGLSQLKKFDFIVERKNEIYQLYKKLLSGVENIEILTPSNKIFPYIPFRVAILTKDKSENLMKFMSENGIEARTFFYPLHKQPCMKQFSQNHKPFKNSIYVYEHGVCLPSYVALDGKKIEYICSAIEKYYGKSQS